MPTRAVAVRRTAAVARAARSGCACGVVAKAAPVASTLALVAAFLFALAATLQQKGALNLPSVSLASPASLLRLARADDVAGRDARAAHRLRVPGGGARPRPPRDHPAAARHDRRLRAAARLLPDAPARGRREVGGAAVIIVGLALFTYFGDPAGGNENAPGSEWAIAIAVIVVLCGRAAHCSADRGGLVDEGRGLRHRRGHALRALRGAHEADARVPARRRRRAALALGGYALAVAGVLGFVLQQVSLGTGRLAPSVATVSVANPVVGILLGVDPARRAPQPAGLARRPRRRRPRARARRRGRRSRWRARRRERARRPVERRDPLAYRLAPREPRAAGRSHATRRLPAARRRFLSDRRAHWCSPA